MLQTFSDSKSNASTKVSTYAKRISVVLLNVLIVCAICASCGSSSSYDHDEPYKLIKPYEDETYSNAWRERWQAEGQQKARIRQAQIEAESE